MRTWPHVKCGTDICAECMPTLHMYLCAVRKRSMRVQRVVKGQECYHLAIVSDVAAHAVEQRHALKMPTVRQKSWKQRLRLGA